MRGSKQSREKRVAPHEPLHIFTSTFLLLFLKMFPIIGETSMLFPLCEVPTPGRGNIVIRPITYFWYLALVVELNGTPS